MNRRRFVVSQRARWLGAVGVLLAAFTLAWLAWGLRPATTDASLPAVPPGPSAAVQPAPDFRTGMAPRQIPERGTGPPGISTDVLGNAPDLRRIYDQYIGSTDGRQRRIAARAFDACIPAFLPNAEQAPSPEPLIRALPAAGQRAEREAAYRGLFARCQRFLSESRADLEQTREDLQRDPQTQAPGQRAKEALFAGRLDEVERRIAEAAAGADPADVESLDGLALRLAKARKPEAPDAALIQRARIVDAALPWVACDLGLDCSAGSLWALQLCASEGLCDGDALARMSARFAMSAADLVLVQQQRTRLLALIRSGRVLTTTGLLP